MSTSTVLQVLLKNFLLTAIKNWKAAYIRHLGNVCNKDPRRLWHAFEDLSIHQYKKIKAVLQVNLKDVNRIYADFRYDTAEIESTWTSQKSFDKNSWLRCAHKFKIEYFCLTCAYYKLIYSHNNIKPVCKEALTDVRPVNVLRILRKGLGNCTEPAYSTSKLQ